MTDPTANPSHAPILWAVAAAILSGSISAVTLNPMMDIMEQSGGDDLFALLSSFAFSAGLAFGLCGGAVALRVMRIRTAGVAVFVLTSMIGIAAAVYVAMMSFDNSTDSFLLPYSLGSPVGALIVAIPFAFVGRFANPWRTAGLATVLSTVWAVGVALVVDADAALEIPGLAALYIGWQAIFLGVFAATGRRAD